MPKENDRKTMKITIIAGARPNFMKIAPLMRAIHQSQEQGNDIHVRLVYTGSAKEESLEATLFNDLDMPQPDAYLEVESNDFFQRLAGIIVTFSKELEIHPTDIVMVVDDLTPTMACSIVARKKGIKVAHLVAGIRSFDLNKPKELNRMITDGLSDILFTASMTANRNLNQTGTESQRIHFVGNILIDSIRHNRNRLKQPDFFQELNLKEKGYLLLTLNRHALLEDKEKLKALVETIQAHSRLPIIAPLHQYVKDQLQASGCNCNRIHLLEPQPYLSFGYLTQNAKGIITDSGNVAEEATFLGIPCMTLNTYAEHPETIHLGTNCLIGDNLSLLAESLDTLQQGNWKKGQLPERWDGRTAERIVQTLIEYEKWEQYTS